jgi:hypothetical protein
MYKRAPLLQIMIEICFMMTSKIHLDGVKFWKMLRLKLSNDKYLVKNLMFTNCEIKDLDDLF